jgi:hypothetical protein
VSIWPALLVAPSLVVLDVSLSHALATPSCATQQEALIRLVLIGTLVLSFVFTLLVWREALRPDVGATTGAAREASGGPAERVERHAFMARVALGVGALSTLAIGAMAIPAWVLSPCAA